MRYRIELADGKDLALSVAGSFLTSRQQLLPRATWTPLAGTVFHPSRFRARAGLTYGSERFTLAAFVSHMRGLAHERQAWPEPGRAPCGGKVCQTVSLRVGPGP